MAQPQDDQACSLCGRSVPPRLITLHHLMPKQKGGTADDRVPLCRPCHKQVHATFTNTELAQQFSTLRAIRETPRMQSFLKWIRKQKPDRDFQTIDPRQRPGRRRWKRRF